VSPVLLLLFFLLTALNCDTGEWPDDPVIIKAIEADFSGSWGDRRQELVFIGEKVNEKDLNEVFDRCLLTATEMRKWEAVMKRKNYTPEQAEDKLNIIFEGTTLWYSDLVVVLTKCVYLDGFEDWGTIVAKDQHDHIGHDHY